MPARDAKHLVVIPIAHLSTTLRRIWRSNIPVHPKIAYCQSVGINAVDFPVPLEARVDARESSVKRERHTKTAVPATSAETVYMRRRHEGGRGGGRRLHSILGR